MYLGDVTVGLVLVVVFLRLVHALAVRFAIRDLVDSGYYGDPPSWRIWFVQFGGFMTAELLSKLMVFATIWILYEPLAAASTALFAGFGSHRHLELLLVMVILPGVCNSLLFWVSSTRVCLLARCLGRYVADTDRWLTDPRLAAQVLRRPLEVQLAARDARRETPHPPLPTATASDRRGCSASFPAVIRKLRAEARDPSVVDAIALTPQSLTSSLID